MANIKLDITFDILETDRQLADRIQKAIRDDLNKALPKIEQGVADDFAQLILKRIYRESPEYQSISTGQLRIHFGIKRGRELEVLDEILNFLADSVKVKFKRVGFRGGRMIGGLELSLVFDYDDIIRLKGAIHTSINNKQVPWLEWLLTRGDSIILKNWKIVFGSFVTSASGQAVMLEEEGSAWKVPAEFSGTVGANWFTRMFAQNKDFIEDGFAKSIDRRLDRVL